MLGRTSHGHVAVRGNRNGHTADRESLAREAAAALSIRQRHTVVHRLMHVHAVILPVRRTSHDLDRQVFQKNLHHAVEVVRRIPIDPKPVLVIRPALEAAVIQAQAQELALKNVNELF